MSKNRAKTYDSPCKCSICDLGFSRIDILERHANHFHDVRMSQNIKNCDYGFSKTVNLEDHTEPIHIKKG